MANQPIPEEPRKDIIALALSTKRAREVTDELLAFIEDLAAGRLNDDEILATLGGNSIEAIGDTHGLPDRVKELRKDITRPLAAGHRIDEPVNDWAQQLDRVVALLEEIGEAVRRRVAGDIRDRLFARGGHHGPASLADQLRHAAERYTET